MTNKKPKQKGSGQKKLKPHSTNSFVVGMGISLAYLVEDTTQDNIMQDIISRWEQDLSYAFANSTSTNSALLATITFQEMSSIIDEN